MSYRQVEVRDSRMSYQEPISTTSSTTTKNDNPMSSQEPKPRTTASTTAENDNHMSCQKPKSKSTSTTLILTSLMLLFIPIIGVALLFITVPPHAQDPKPTEWPDQFHSRIVMNNSGSIELVDFWYDRTNGRSLNIIQRQRGSVLYDLEWDNGAYFHYTLGSHGTCSSSHLEVTTLQEIKKEGGILKPDWLDQMSYVGQREVDGSLCNVWENAEFITYYEDAVTKLPMRWVFNTGREAHVMTFKKGAALEDAKWQVPDYCFLVDSGTPKVEDMQN